MIKFIKDIAQRYGFTHQADLPKLRRNWIRSFEAAGMNRLTADFSTTTTTIDNDLRAGIVPIRNRARLLSKNNDYVRRFLDLFRANVVGPNGFTFQSNVTELVEDPKEKTTKRVPDKVANAKIQDAWADWIQSLDCSVNGRQNFIDICNMLAFYKARDGETFLRFIFNKKSKYGLQLQIIPPEACDEQYCELRSNGNVVKMGVELDKWRKPVAYWIKTIRPEFEAWGYIGYSTEREPIPASEMIHGFDREYADQTRGVSRLASAMIHLHWLKGYEEASVINARSSAAKGVFFKRTGDGEKYSGQGEDADGNLIMSIQPGVGEELPAGLDPVGWDPQYPHAQHAQFMKTTLRGIASGLKVAYSSLANDYESANYSSLRAELLVEREMWKTEQQWFIDNILKPVFEIWLESAIIQKAIYLPFEKFEKFNKPVFIGRKWDWVDPSRDVSAKMLAIKGGLESPYDIAGERGKALEDIYSDIAEATALAKEKGITFDYSGTDINMIVADNKPSAKPPLDDDRFALHKNSNGDG